MKQFFRVSLAFIAAACLAGCVVGLVPDNISARWVVPGDTDDIKLASTAPRAGQVILLRGLLGLWSYGMDSLSDRLKAAGVRSLVFKHEQWPSIARRIEKLYSVPGPREPLIIVGHSYGADDAISLARELWKHHVQVDLLCTFDPVNPGHIPPNVVRVVNFYEERGITDVLPMVRGVAVKPEGSNTASSSNYTTINGTEYLSTVVTREPSTAGTVENIRLNDHPDLRAPLTTTHFNLDENRKLQELFVARVLEICPLRSRTAISR